MRDAGLSCGTVHCDNTPATILDASTHYDMVRVGVGLYGLQPCDATRPRISLEPVMSVRARVTRTAHPAMGEGVGYGFTYRVPRTAVQICTLPLGYADGSLARFPIAWRCSIAVSACGRWAISAWINAWSPSMPRPSIPSPS